MDLPIHLGMDSRVSSQASSVLPGWDVNNIPSFILYAHIHPGLIFIPGEIPGIV